MLEALPYQYLGAPDPVRHSVLLRVHHGYQRPEELFEETTSAAVGFIEKHADLLPLLARIRGKIRSYFGPDVPTRLAVTRTEEPTEPEQLVVHIRTAGNVDGAVDALSRFDEEWWMDADNSEDRIIVDVRPR